MCKVSDRLKLCSCKTENVETLKHYWILKRHNGGDDSIMGDAIMPANIGENANDLNIDTILTALNEGNCFDIEMQHKQNDTLELHFRLDSGYLAYSFKFENNRWKKTEYDPFGANLENIQEGKIARPFLKNQNK